MSEITLTVRKWKKELQATPTVVYDSEQWLNPTASKDMMTILGPYCRPVTIIIPHVLEPWYSVEWWARWIWGDEL